MSKSLHESEGPAPSNLAKHSIMGKYRCHTSSGCCHAHAQDASLPSCCLEVAFVSVLWAFSSSSLSFCMPCKARFMKRASLRPYWLHHKFTWDTLRHSHLDLDDSGRRMQTETNQTMTIQWQLADHAACQRRHIVLPLKSATRKARLLRANARSPHPALGALLVPLSEATPAQSAPPKCGLRVLYREAPRLLGSSTPSNSTCLATKHGHRHVEFPVGICRSFRETNTPIGS